MARGLAAFIFALGLGIGTAPAAPRGAELQLKLVEILASIQSGVGKAADFTLAQLPDIAQQYVMWGRASATADLLILVTLTALAVYVAVRYGLMSKEVDVYGGWTGARYAAALVGGAAALFSGLGANLSVSRFLLVWFAPKVWLLKEIAGLLK